MTISSSAWAALIAVGAVIVAVANIQYNRARDAENKSTKAVQARELLQIELAHNKELLGQMQAALPASITLRDFDTAAWQTVSSSGLLLGLPNDELGRLLQAYKLMIRANELRSKTLDLMVGVTSALVSAPKTRELYTNELAGALAELQPLLRALVP